MIMKYVDGYVVEFQFIILLKEILYTSKMQYFIVVEFHSYFAKRTLGQLNVVFLFSIID